MGWILNDPEWETIELKKSGKSNAGHSGYEGCIEDDKTICFYSDESILVIEYPISYGEAIKGKKRRAYVARRAINEQRRRGIKPGKKWPIRYKMLPEHS